jgi:hypothetical protein
MPDPKIIYKRYVGPSMPGVRLPTMFGMTSGQGKKKIGLKRITMAGRRNRAAHQADG